MSEVPDPFQHARQQEGKLVCPFNHEQIPMLLRHADVRAAAKDWKTYSSDAPQRVPIPSEEDVRSMRQLPIETDPPDHTEYREIVEPFFRRPKDPAMVSQVEALVQELVTGALGRDSIEIVREFALPLQSRALTYLLNVPEEKAALWISWGTHVFHDGDGEKKGAALERYLQEEFDRAEANPGENFFSALTRATFRGQRLTREEMMGFANLTFAGGRDTIIHTVSSVFDYFGKNPAALASLREDPSRIVHACEEFFRIVSPLTVIGRVCPVDTTVHGTVVKAGERIGLGWAAANLDESVFPSPGEIRLDRKPNPHVAFGFGAHLCLGAAHARLLLRTLLQCLSEQVATVTVLTAEPNVEKNPRYERSIGFQVLNVKLAPR